MKINKHIHKILLVLLVLASLQGYSQQDPSLGRIFDRYGKPRSLKELTITATERTTQRSALVTCSSTSYFNLYFETGSGMEDVSNPIHNARREVACKVFETLSGFINSPLASSGNKVNIWVRNMAGSGAPPGTLGMASSYYIAPYNSNIPTGGILDGEIWKTIHLGIDSYVNTGNPGNFYHGEIAFNFSDPNIQWHTNLAVAAPSTLYDLYTVMLHEITHSLGFSSFINQNGTSITEIGYYSRYDTFLKTNTGNLPLLSIGSCKMYDVDFNEIVPLYVLRPGCTSPDNLNSGSLNNTLCNEAVKFSGTATVPVYTPSCFEPGSSLSHFEDQLYPSCTNSLGNDAYFVLSNSIGKGITKRYLRGEERKTMCDLGYSVKTTFGSSTSGIAGGYVNYGGTVCGGTAVAGMNDGIGPDGSYTFMGAISIAGETSTNVAISGLLSNDVGATGFECLQDITAAATFSSTAGSAGTTVNFTTAIPGLHLLRYVPINGTQRGNITYVHVYILPPPNLGGCSPVPIACNLVMNGDFEQYSELPTRLRQITRACGWNYPHTNEQFAPSYFNALVDPSSTESANTVDVPCNNYGYQEPNKNIGNGYANIIISKHHLGTQHLYTALKAPLEPNTTYQLSFDASLAEGSSYFASNLQAYLSNTQVLPLTPMMEIDIPDPAKLLTSPDVVRNTSGWDTITFTFTTAAGGEQFLYLGVLSNAAVLPNDSPTPVSGCDYLNYVNEEQTLPLTFRRSYNIDNVVLIPTDDSKLELPTALCSGQKLDDLKAFLSNVSEDGTFSGTGVLLANGTYSFDPAVSGVGNVTIGYTFTTANGCQATLYDSIRVSQTSLSGIIGDAVNDNFTAAPIASSTGGTTPSVYSNDKYNGVLSTPATLSEVSFALVAPVSLAGASIDASGAITVPADIPSGTYTLTYSLSVLGNCATTDNATVTILISTANESSLPASSRANDDVRLLAQQTTGKIIISGFFTAYNNVPKNHIARLNPDLTLDPSFTFTGTMEAVGMAVQSDNKIIVATGNPLFGGTSCIARLLPDGGPDPTFNAGGVGTAKLSSRSNNSGYATAVLPDGKILVGGDFYYYNGVQRFGIARLLANGTLDSSFVPAELNSYYWSVVKYMLVQPDGRILLLGHFSIPVGSNGYMVKNILRLNANGSLDSSFLAGNTEGSVDYHDLNVSIFGPLARMALQGDGKVVVVGGFTKYNGTNVSSIVRLGANGQIDPTFNTAFGVDRGINDVLMEPGTMKIIIGGEFTAFNGLPVKKMLRLNPNGTLDPTFSIGEGTTDAPPPGDCIFCANHVKALKRQTDGKIIVGGGFTTFNGVPAGNITRISGNSGFQSRIGSTIYESEPEIDASLSYSKIKIYPNPSRELFNIDLSREREAYSAVSVYTILGDKIYSASLIPKENNVINLSHLSSGYYMARLENGATTMTVKLIKN